MPQELHNARPQAGMEVERDGMLVCAIMPRRPSPTATDPLAPLLAEAAKHEQAGRLAETEHLVRQALTRAPDHPGALFALARLGMRAGRFTAVIGLAERALATVPQAPELHRIKGQALANLGRLEDGIASLDRAVALAPQWAEAVLDLGTLLFQAERMGALLDHLATVDGPTPIHAEIHTLRGRALMVLGRPEHAEPAFVRALALVPGHAEAAYGLAALNIERDRPEDALAVVKPLGEQTRFRYLQGVALGMLGRETEAEDCLAQVRTRLLTGLEQRDNLPTEVYVQLSRRCNLRCTMCGHEVWKDNSGFMSDEVFERVLVECEAAKIRHMTILAAQGEPFLHPRAFEMMELAVSRGLELTVVTNGTPFTPERIERLAGLGLACLQFSFAGWDAPSYENVYIGAKFDRAVKTLQAMDRALKPTRTVFMVKAVAPDNSEDYVTRTRAFLSSLGIDRINTVAPNNFGGTVKIGRFWDKAGIWSYRDLDKQRRTVCRVLMRSVGIYVDGSVTACGCYDANAALRIGDITRASLREIRNGDAFGAMLMAFGSGDVSSLPLCSQCDDPFG